MKKIYLFVSLICAAAGWSQNFADYASMTIKTAQDCEKAEPKVLECANYLLSTPATDDINALDATQFIMRWMEATPDHTFELGGDLFVAISSDTNIVARYLAAQATTAISYRSSDKQAFATKFASVFLEYCEKPENKVKLNSKLKKYIKARNDGTLSALLNKKE